MKRMKSFCKFFYPDNNLQVTPSRMPKSKRERKIHLTQTNKKDRDHKTKIINGKLSSNQHLALSPSMLATFIFMSGGTSGSLVGGLVDFLENIRPAISAYLPNKRKTIQTIPLTCVLPPSPPPPCTHRRARCHRCPHSRFSIFLRQHAFLEVQGCQDSLP